MIVQLRESLLAHARAWNLPEAGKWSFIVHNNYQPVYSCVNIFWFNGRGRNPLVVTKLFPEPVLPQQEYRNLCDAHACAPGAVPAPFALNQHGTSWALWMAGIPGSRLRVCDVTDGFVDRLCDMSVMIQRGVAARRQPNPRRYEEYVVAPLRFAISHYPGIAAACDRLLRWFERNGLEQIPSLPQHGDLYCENIVVNGGKKWAIVDWELLGTVDLPFYDVAKFIFSLHSEVVPERWPADLRRHAHRLVRRYSEAIGLGTETVEHLLPLILANWLYRQALAPGKARAAAALENWCQNPAWRTFLLGATTSERSM